MNSSCVLSVVLDCRWTVTGLAEVIVMDILVSTGSLPWLPLDKRIRAIAAAGADGLELLLTPRLLHHDPTALAQQARQLGVPVRAVHAVLRLRRDCTISELQASVRFAQALPDCTVLVIHPPQPVTQTHRWVQALQAARMETGAPLRIAVETPGQHTAQDRPVPYDDGEFFLRFVEEWDLAITADTAHIASLGWDLLGFLRRCLPRLAHVHLSDATDQNFGLALANALLRDHRLPGTGCLPLDTFLRALCQSTYQGYVTLELSPIPLFALRLRSTVQRLERALAAVRRSLDDPRDRAPSSIPGSTPETN
mgnify:CR=1 FL=1